jgi:cell division septation protein DedD
LVATLTERGYPAYREQIASTNTPYAVRVGPFTSRAQAEVTKQRLAREPEGFDSLIIR